MYATFDTVLVGRMTYKEMAAYWPAAETEEGGSAINKSLPPLIMIPEGQRPELERSHFAQGRGKVVGLYEALHQEKDDNVRDHEHQRDH